MSFPMMKRMVAAAGADSNAKSLRDLQFVTLDIEVLLLINKRKNFFFFLA